MLQCLVGCFISDTEPMPAVLWKDPESSGDNESGGPLLPVQQQEQRTLAVNGRDCLTEAVKRERESGRRQSGGCLIAGAAALHSRLSSFISSLRPRMTSEQPRASSLSEMN